MNLSQRFNRHKHEDHSYGPFGFLNPTIRNLSFPEHIDQAGKETASQPEPATKSPKPWHHEIHSQFRTRDNRKGRHALLLTHHAHTSPKISTPPPTTSLPQTLHTIRLMFTSFPYWDISYLVAIIFTFGSVIWCVNAFFVWLPLQVPSSEFEGEIGDAGGITAFIGATVFEIGSVFLMLEAVNEKREGCFGWAVEELIGKEVRVGRGVCGHHHGNKGNLVGKGGGGVGDVKEQPDGEGVAGKENRSWVWWPTWHELRTHYSRDIGFLACLAQMIGATVFWISGFTALPPIYDALTSRAAQNGAFWLPQVIGGTGFIISGTLFMLETQSHWYRPAFSVLGWHIGAWNLIGGIGFTLCGALGFASSNSGCVYQGSLATFWGSWCFLIGSVIQWFESLEKFPVVVVEVGGGERGGDGKAEMKGEVV